MKNELQTTFNDLYDCCLYSSIAHAIGNIKSPFFSYEQSWEEQNYSFHYEATRGTVAFDFEKRILAGAIRAEQSNRMSWYPKFQAIELFKDAPKAVQHLASQETLQYLLLGESPGKVMSVATTAFWSEGDKIISCDNDEDFFENGGEFISNILCPLPELNRYWTEYCDFSTEESKLIDHLFRLKKRNILKLSENDIPVCDRKSEGYEEFVVSIKEIGFVI